MAMSGLENTKPFEHSPLYEQVHRRLREALMAGRFKPGEPLTLRGIAEQLGVGVMPVRSAVRQLVECGALEMPTSRSTRIPAVSMKRFEAVHNLRRLLEGEAAAEAAVNATNKEIAGIEKLHGKLEQQSNSASLQQVLQLNRDFHFAVYQASGNAIMVGFIEDLWLQNGPYLALVAEHPDAGRQSYFGHHHTLMRALRERRPDRARAAMVADLEDSMAHYDKRLASVLAEGEGNANKRTG